MSIRQLCFTEWPQCGKFEVPSGRNVQWCNMRPHISYFDQLARQICKIEATFEKAGVQYRLIDTPYYIH